MKIRFKQLYESDINFSEENEKIVTVKDGKLVNNIRLSNDSDANTAVLRDRNGRIKVSSPEDGGDAINLDYLNNALLHSAFPGFSNTSTILWNRDDDGKYIASLDVNSVRRGSILRLNPNEDRIVSASYYNETDGRPETDGRAIITKAPAFIGSTNSSIRGTTFSVEADKSVSLDKNDVAIITTTADKNYGPKINTYAFLSNEIGPTTVTSGQTLLDFGVNGFLSGDFFNAISLKVKTSDVFDTDNPKAELSMEQNGLPIFSTDINNNIKVEKGLILGGSSENIVGSVIYSQDSGHFIGYNGERWVNLDMDSGSASVTNDIESVYDVGGVKKGYVVPAGTTIDGLAKMVFDPVTINAVYGNFGDTAHVENGGALEVGQPVTLNGFSYVSSTEYSHCNVIGDGFVETHDYGDHTILDAETPYSFTVGNQEYSWNIVARTDDGRIARETFSFKGGLRFSYGCINFNMIESGAPSDISSLINSLDYDILYGNPFGYNKEGHYIYSPYEAANTNNYFVFAFPYDWRTSFYGVFNHGVPIMHAFKMIGRFTYRSVYGVNQAIVLYQSYNPGALRCNSKITFK